MNWQLVAGEKGVVKLQASHVAPRLQRAFRESVGAGMLDLLYHGLPPQAEPILCYLHQGVRQAAMRYLRELRQGKEASFAISPEQAQQELDAIPPLGGDSLCSSDIQAWYASLDAALAQRAEKAGQSPEQCLASLSPAWEQLGMLCLHLAENAGDGAEQAPFAFLASFVHKLGADDKARHMPLGLAARVYEQDKQALLSLLRPLQQVAAQSSFMDELIRSGKIYQACAWSAQECYNFLNIVPLLEQQGIETRMVKLRKKMPPRVELEVKLDAENPPQAGDNKDGLQLHSLLHFSLRTALAGMQLSDEELEQLMQNDQGLIRFKGEWIRLDAPHLQEVMSQWKAALRMSAGGIPLIVGLRYLLGKRSDALPHLPPIAEGDPVQVRCGEKLLAMLEKMQKPQEEKLLLPPELDATLRPYQRQGAQFLKQVTQLGLGACLADDMGLGKSIQCIAYLCHLANKGLLGAAGQGAALIIAPASLLHNWKEEIHRFAPHLSCLILHPQQLSKDQQAQLENAPSKLLQKVDVAITSYGIATRHKKLAEMEHPVLMLDEAQAIKNASSQRTQALLRYNSPRRIAISGTPIENKLQELHSLFNYLNPGLLGSIKQFEAQLRDMGSNYSPLKQQLKPFLLRRHKTDKNIAPELPEKIQKEHYCQLTPEQAQLYAREVERMQAIINEPDPKVRMALLLPLLTHLKQICNHPAQYLGEPHFDKQRSGKMAQLGQLLRKLAEAGEPCLIFTQYRSIIDALHEQSAEYYGQSGLVLHGGIGIKERQLLVEQFQGENGPPYMILSLKAAGTGLTLTRARHVIHFDRWWNPAVEAQASDRVHRIGQKRSVYIHPFMARGTIEENIHRMLRRKEEMAKGVLAEGLGQLMSQMTGEELMELLRLRED